jgi:hypothetical protein
MVRCERAEKTAIEVPINVVTEWNNCPFAACSRKECRRNSVMASLSQRGQQEPTENIIVIPEQAVSTMLNPLAERCGLNAFRRFKRWKSSCTSIADVSEADKLTRLMTDDRLSRQAPPSI